MLTAERRHYILAALDRDGKVLASALSQQLDVSEDTIRRDLRELADSGLLQRVHGGALPRSPAATTFGIRQRQSFPAKAAIAAAAVQLVRDGQVIILDGGTTTLQVAQRLPQQLMATVITTSPPIAVALAEHPTIEVIVIGGRLHKESLLMTGATTVAALGAIRADLCMLGVCSLHPEVGISLPNLEESLTKRAMLMSAAEVVALASAEKLGTTSAYIAGAIGELTHLLTERSVPDEILDPYRRAGITVLKG